MIQIFGGFERGIHPPYKESIIRGLTKFLSVKIVEYDHQSMSMSRSMGTITIMIISRAGHDNYLRY